MEGLLACFTVLTFEFAAFTDYGELRVELKKKGTTIGPLDFLIAAHARSLGAAIATGNVSEFKGGKGLKVVAWK